MSSNSSSRSIWRVVGRLAQVLSWVGIIVIALVVSASVLVPRLAGAQPYTILTGSMRPSLPPGTLVVVKPVDATEINVGDVITYQLESGKDVVVTHRVVEQGLDADRRPVFRTQGDANPSPDPSWVRPAQVRGQRWYSIPLVGRLGGAFSGREHEVLDVGVGVLLFGYAGRTLLVVRRERRELRDGRRRAGAAPEHAEGKSSHKLVRAHV